MILTLIENLNDHIKEEAPLGTVFQMKGYNVLFTYNSKKYKNNFKGLGILV